jgi:hypothetical protein
VRFLQLTVQIAALVLACSPLTAHPGESSYWLIEAEGQVIKSRVLIPYSSLIHFPGLDQNADGVVVGKEVIASKDGISALLREHLVLQAVPALERTQAEEFSLESSGFLEVVTSYRRPLALKSLKLRSSFHRLAGNDHPILCRVVRGTPERFILDGQMNSVEIELAVVEATRGQTESRPSGLLDSLSPEACILILLLVSGLLALLLRMLWRNGFTVFPTAGRR